LKDGLIIIINTPVGEDSFWTCDNLANTLRLSVFLLAALLATFLPTTTADKNVGPEEWIIVRCSK
jgi:hypothetical protein